MFRLEQRKQWVAAAASAVVLGVLSQQALVGRLSAQPVQPAPVAFANNTIDIGMVVTDGTASAKFFTEALGFTEVPGFSVAGEFAQSVGLSNGVPLSVRVLTLGEGPGSTKLKLIHCPTAPGARPDQTFLHSTYGFRYLTIHVKDLNAAVAHASENGAKPIAKGAQPLPAELAPGIGLASFRDPDGNLIELVGPFKAN